jgi:CheY-like chemotaxis protein
MLIDGISPRIMIVDDSRINMMLEETILRNMIPNVDVIKANDGRQAVEKARQMKPDLILMDVQMPEMNGLEASREIRKFNTRIPIIALTAGIVKEEIDKCYEAGMNGFLAKPIDNSALFKILKEKLEK